MIQITTTTCRDEFRSGFDISIAWDLKEIGQYNREDLIDANAQMGPDALREQIVTEVLMALREIGIEQTPNEVMVYARMIAAAGRIV